MLTAIKETARQFGFKPEIVHAGLLHKTEKYLLVGMGGSHLAADLLKRIAPDADIIIHRNYGLPQLADLEQRLIILSSYSGNTEEVLDAYETAGKQGLARVVISIGGKLIEWAMRDQLPYVKMPDFCLQPRLALPLNLLSLLKIMDKHELLVQAAQLHTGFHPEQFEAEGKELALKLRGYVPIIDASEMNQAIAYIWKIKFNETGKIPAFYNVFPELNHNEMTGFDVQETTKGLSDRFCFLFFLDEQDNPRIQKRMQITAHLFKERALSIHELKLQGKNIFYRIFNSLVVGDWAAYYTAQGYGVEAEQVPMIEEFKKLMSQ